MIEPADSTTGHLQAHLDGKIEDPVCDNDVATVSKCRVYARYCRESLRVENGGHCAEEVSYVALKVHLDICKAKPFTTRRKDLEKQTHQWYRRIQEGHSYRRHVPGVSLMCAF